MAFNALAWGLMDNAPNALVWEIGHTGDYTILAGQYCVLGSATKPHCYSNNTPTAQPFCDSRTTPKVVSSGQPAHQPFAPSSLIASAMAASSVIV